MNNENQESNQIELFTKVRKALLLKWDPIGIKDLREAADEYDSYAPKLCDLLLSKASRQEIIDYLWFIETNHMGLQGRRVATEKFVDYLIKLTKIWPNN